MRKYLIGLVTGVLLTLPIGIFANDISNIGKKIDSEFTVLLNGEELPVKAIGINGTSYIPLRATGEALGLNVDFVDRTVILESKKEGDNVIEETTFNGLRTVEVDGETYFSARDYADILHETSAINLGVDIEKRIFYYARSSSPTQSEIYHEFSMDEPNAYNIHNGETYINIRYYKESSDFE